MQQVPLGQVILVAGVVDLEAFRGKKKKKRKMVRRLAFPCLGRRNYYFSSCEEAHRKTAKRRL